MKVLLSTDMRSMKMSRRFIPIILLIIGLCSMHTPSISAEQNTEGHIRRLTQSGNNVARYPCLSRDGKRMLYVLEIEESERDTKAIMVMNIEDGKETELFRDGTLRASPPYEDSFLCVGSKPPVLSGDGKVAVFTLSIKSPHNLLDHFLAVVPADGSNFWKTSFPIQNLMGVDLESHAFKNGNWERVANFALSADGNRIACLVKGHSGPRKFGSASGIIYLDVAAKKQLSLLSPEFRDEGWIWTSFPRRPSTGGGWAFCMSEDGETIVFGAQTSEDPNDYDLYMAEWMGREMERLTDFSDRWFSLADISQDGQTILFYYNGHKKRGIGTYRIDRDGTDMTYLESRSAPRIDFFEMSGDGRFVLFKNIYRGQRLDLRTGEEIVAFSEETDGYVEGIIPMDFPQFPSFWKPRIMSASADRVLLAGPPLGKDSPEIYLLTLDRE